MQTKPHGKGLTGFIFGLLLATFIIGAVLYFLNNTPSGIKQPEAPKTETQPEILTPRQQPQPTAAAGSDASGSSGRYTLPPGDITDQPPATASAPAQASTPETRPEQPKPQQQAKPREPQRKPEPEAKPTPQQILESGNVERAREQARRERREAEAKAAEQRNSQRNAEQHANNGGRYIVQMGSYNNPEAADSQRAKLAMLGIDARVSSSQRNGQTVYRIQSGRLSRAQADALSERLRSNGVDSLTRQAD
ncbi:SPOR domain-containing protein [Eikenella sp. S3360]|uniref:SPOR domain-containing protein n=1 Tax=Eikenella glucosivorans TaxID=2766967 RepID=A0ABS0NBY4_9NEIS|nr:SPOR domain-containing protein [Eikenella glucosivorans]MBH5329818.1 SPOR domain-containing protein [Eikenella glucosivorans]